MAGEWDGRPLREQNLSEWRKGGYRDWLVQQEALELATHLAEDAAELAAEDRPPLTDTLAIWVAARYAVATRRVAEAEGREGWRLLRELCGDLVELRRGDHSAQRLRMERERLDFERERDREKTEEELMTWARENRDRICAGFRTNAEKIAMLRKAMFDDLDDPALHETVTESLRKAEVPASGLDGCGGIFSNREMEKPEGKQPEQSQP